MVADRSFRHAECSRELGRARGALVEESDDPSARGIAERTKPLGLLDDEDVIELVIGRTVDDRETYGKSRPLATL